MPALGCHRRVGSEKDWSANSKTSAETLAGRRRNGATRALVKQILSTNAAPKRKNVPPANRHEKRPASPIGTHVEHVQVLLLSTLPSSISAIITCSAVGREGKRTAISDRDMQSERPEYSSKAQPLSTSIATTAARLAVCACTMHVLCHQRARWLVNRETIIDTLCFCAYCRCLVTAVT